MKKYLKYASYASIPLVFTLGLFTPFEIASLITGWAIGSVAGAASIYYFRYSSYVSILVLLALTWLAYFQLAGMLMGWAIGLFAGATSVYYGEHDE